MQKKKGISLIVLVITIIVMIILAGSIVLTLNNSGIIDKASEAVEQSNLATVKQVAELAWADAYLKYGADEVELEKTVRDSLEANGITEQHYLGYDFRITTEGVKLIKAHNMEVIPEGAVYYTNCFGAMPENHEGATVIKAGEKFPDTSTLGDTYVYNNYEYRYGFELGYDYTWYESADDGWGVAVIGDETTGRAVLESINNKPITSMMCLFFESNITILESDFVIPETVCNTHSMFDGSGLTELPKNFTLPSTVFDAGMMFLGCSSLSNLPENFKVPSGAEVELMFGNCTSLESLPKNFTVSASGSASGMFIDCTSLTGTVTINSDSEGYDGCFSGTTQPITIKGTSKNLNKIAATAENGNVTVAE